MGDCYTIPTMTILARVTFDSVDNMAVKPPLRGSPKPSFIHCGLPLYGVSSFTVLK